MVYWILLIITALFAYLFGCLDSMVLASNFVFHRNLRRLGRGSVWLSNFRRIYGAAGFVKILLVEAVKDAIPILIGLALLSIRGHGSAGALFAAFCLVLGRLYPATNRFSGGHAALALIAAGFAGNVSVGAAAAVVMLAVTYLTKYITLGTAAGAVVFAVVSIMVLGDDLLVKLAVITAGFVLIKHIPALIRVFRGQEEKLSFREDLTYKLDM